MKRIVYALLATVSGVVLLFSYRTSLDAVLPTASGTPADTGTTAATPGTGGTAPTAGGGAASSTAGSTATTGWVDGTYPGNAVSTPYGDVQVQIVVSGGVISDVQVTQYPSDDGRSRQINARALPVLVEETTATQSADIRLVSGATYTSRGYVKSLQSAIDQAQR